MFRQNLIEVEPSRFTHLLLWGDTFQIRIVSARSNTTESAPLAGDAQSTSACFISFDPPIIAANVTPGRNPRNVLGTYPNSPGPIHGIHGQMIWLITIRFIHSLSSKFPLNHTFNMFKRVPGGDNTGVLRNVADHWRKEGVYILKVCQYPCTHLLWCPIDLNVWSLYSFKLFRM